MIDQVFERLPAAPTELNPTVVKVLVAIGRFAGAILKEGYAEADRQSVTNWFCNGLQSYVNRTSEAIVRHWLTLTRGGARASPRQG